MEFSAKSSWTDFKLHYMAMRFPYLLCEMVFYVVYECNESINIQNIAVVWNGQTRGHLHYCFYNESINIQTKAVVWTVPTRRHSNIQNKAVVWTAPTRRHSNIQNKAVVWTAPIRRHWNIRNKAVVWTAPTRRHLQHSSLNNFYKSSLRLQLATNNIYCRCTAEQFAVWMEWVWS